MKTLNSKKRTTAMTMFELFIVMATLSILGLLLLPALQRPRGSSHRIYCVNNLKQLGLSFRTWSIDSTDKLPMEVSTNQGGSREVALGPRMFTTFQVMSNELSTPKILLCPEEAKRTAATTFQLGFTNSNISYFVGLDVTGTNVAALLSGDRNLTNGLPIRGGLMQLTAAQRVGWSQELHKGNGNILLADGSVQQVSAMGLSRALQAADLGTNRLAMP